MRGLERNKRSFFYALYTGEEALVDENGDYTGETRSTYTDPVACEANISPASGTAVTELFGTVSEYDRVIGPLNYAIPLDEHAIVWIKNDPETQPHDYVVERIADSINHYMALVSRVELT